MASAPQMRVGPVPTGVPKAAAAEGNAADMFAQLLGLGVESEADAPGILPEGDAPEGTAAAQEGEETLPEAVLPPDLAFLVPPVVPLPAAVSPLAAPGVSETPASPDVDGTTSFVAGPVVPENRGTMPVPAQARWVELRKALEAQHPTVAPDVSPSEEIMPAPAATAGEAVLDPLPVQPNKAASERPRAAVVLARDENRALPSDIEPAAPAQPAQATRPSAKSVTLPLPEVRHTAEAAPAAAPMSISEPAFPHPTALSTSPAPGAMPAAAASPVATAAPDLLGRQLDLASGAEWLDQLARDIAAAGGSEGPMRFRLNPEHLGALKVEIALGEEGSTIRLTTETEAARQMLVDAQPRLLAEARAQGVRVADAHVDLGSAGSDTRSSADGRRQDDRRDPYFRTGAPSGDEPAARPTRSHSDRYA